MNIIKKTIRNIKKQIQANKDKKFATKMISKYLKSAKGKKILLVTHVAHKHASSIPTFNKLFYKLLDLGYEPFVISYQNGLFNETMNELGIKVVTGEIFQYDKDAFLEIAKHFDKIVANSVVTYSAVDWRNDAIWWIQEGQNVEKDFMNYMPNLDRALKNARQIYVVSDYAKETILKYNQNCEVINLGVEDFSKNVISHEIQDKIKFMTVGEINDCKAQDVLMESILKLDKKYLDKSEFHLIFDIRKGHRYRNLNKISKKLGNVYYEHVETDQKKKNQLFEDMDIFIVPSRDEACSLVTLEACMLSKPVILTENVGAKYMINDGINGYIVKTNNSESLKTAIEKIIDSKENLENMGKFSRKMYEEYANENILENNIKKITDYIENM